MIRANVWDGNSGDLFAAMVRQQLDGEGCTARVDVTPVDRETAPLGAYLIEVQVREGPNLLFEVADWVDGARVMDPDGEDLSRVQALNYLKLRCAGLPPRDALRDC